MVRVLFYLILVVVFAACSNEAEKQRVAALQKAREDSIRLAVENETRQRMERKNALADSIKTGGLIVEGMRNQLILLSGDLAAAKDKLNTINGFQFLRTTAEREQQIKDQTVVILSLQNDLSSLQSNILRMQTKIDDWKVQLSQFD